MKSKETKEAKRLVKMVAFAKARRPDFTHTPLTPVDVKHEETIGAMEGYVEDLGGEEAIQKSGEFGQRTEEQRADRGDVESMVRKINTTAASIATERGTPALMDRFRMPHDNADRLLALKLNGFADAIDEMGLVPDLAAHGLVLTTAALRQMAVDLIASAGEQGNALSDQVDATASIPETLKLARGKKKALDAIYGNVYENNVGILAAWKSASHVERDGGSANPPEGGTPEGGTPEPPK